MKIAFITFEYPPCIYGGAGIYAGHMTHEWARHGHTIDVYVPSFCGAESKEDAIAIKNVPTLHIPLIKIPSYWISLFLSFLLFARRENYDIIIGNGFSEFSLFRKICPGPRITIIHHSAKSMLKTLDLTVVERIRNIGNEKGILNRIEGCMVRRADKIVTVSEFSKNAIVHDVSLPPEKITVIYNGIRDWNEHLDEERKRALREHLDVEGVMLLFVG